MAERHLPYQKENMKKFLKYYNNENLHKYLNYEKSAYYNVKIIETHLEEERQFNIAKQQNKIKDLENLSLFQIFSGSNS